MPINTQHITVEQPVTVEQYASQFLNAIRVQIFDESDRQLLAHELLTPGETYRRVLETPTEFQ